MLTEPQIERYARHVLLREVGGRGQLRLLSAAMHVEGASAALGWAVAYATLAGVGRLSLAPGLVVGEAGFGPLVPPSDAGRPLDAALAAALAAFNPDVTLRPGPDATALLLCERPSPLPGVIVRAAGRAALVAPASSCARCVDALLPAAPSSADADALAGSLASTLLLSHLAAGAALPAHVLLGGPEGLSTRSLPACPHAD